MTLYISDYVMTSNVATKVRADWREHATADGHGAWLVTGHPALAARPLDRNAAITAMTLAEFEATGRGGSPHAANWRAELGI